MRYKTVAWGVLGLFVLILGLRTVIRNQDWKDDFTLYSAALRAVPGSAKMHADLGAEYMYRRQTDLARAEFQTALRIFPDFPEAMEWYGLLESNAGHDSEARRQCYCSLVCLKSLCPLFFPR